MTAKQTLYAKLTGLTAAAAPDTAAKQKIGRRTRGSAAGMWAETAIRTLLAAVLAGAALFDGRAPLGVAIVAAAGSGLYGAGALVGACFGSLTTLELSYGLRYASCAILTFAAAFAFYDWKPLRRPWAMPAVAGLFTGFTGLILLSRADRRGWEALFLLLETALTVLAAWAFRGALGPREGRWAPSARARRAGPPALVCACLAALEPLEVFGISLLTVSAVVVCALFLLLPERTLALVGVWLSPERARPVDLHAQRLVRQKLEHTAQAFRALYDSLRSAFRAPDNDNNVAAVFDRTASRVCRSCSLRDRCWKQDYNTTFNALNDATAAMVDRGRAEGGDFPKYFADRCIHFPAFLGVVNEELTALFYRRQYAARVRENRAAVCRQYAQLSDLLGSAAAELSRELTPDLPKEHQVRQRLSELGIRAKAAVYRDSRGLLRVEAEGPGCAELTRPSRLDSLAQLLGVPLRVEEEGRETVCLLQQEPLMALAGVAAKRKSGETVSGDAGTYFKRPDGTLYLLLCDGMGSGPDANRESSLAVRLLEQLLQAGVSARHALTTLASALALRGEETGGFTTVDLLQIDLFSGEGELFKLGAAPTYVKKGGSVQRLSGASLPAGLSAAGQDAPALDHFPVRLSPGDCVLMVSDGVCGGEDDTWLKERFAQFDGASPKELARELITAGPQESTDDRTALVVRLEKRSVQTPGGVPFS